MRRVGYWISEKKSKKLNFEENRSLFRNGGLELVKLDLSKPLEEQGPIDAIVHKVTDILAKAENGNATAQQYIHNIQSYADSHPDCVLLDPLEGTRCLLDRYKQYQQVCSCHLVCRDNRIIIPKFVELTTSDVEENKAKLAAAGVTFPLLVKPNLAHGSRLAHEMAIIFNEECLRDVEAPCVAQSFLNHNALLYKIFVVGSQQFVVQRPSLKNLYPGNQATIFFDTQEVSKPGSSHPLNEIDAGSLEEPLIKPDWSLLEQLGGAISRTLAMSLIGIDVIIDCRTQQYAIIDINSFPGFEGVDDFFTHLRDHILERLRTTPNCDSTSKNSVTAAITTTTTTTAATTTTPTATSTTTTPAQHRPHSPTTGVVNAVNLKASKQQPYILGQSQVIDCRTIVPADSWSVNGSRVLGNDEGEGMLGEGEKEKEEQFLNQKEEQFLNQLTSSKNNNNNNCPSNLLPP
ncbi:inositol-tetrakisphosphate 1-kinase-like [Babylonia areolata]|uniref:inositol-tetrakisphosphate 1-kinase-like n=1 Tax=Babylonia areolata TaxID=304850 RepID=UPI003FD44522